MRDRYDGHQPVDGWSAEEDVVGGIGINDQISDYNSSMGKGVLKHTILTGTRLPRIDFRRFNGDNVDK